MKYKLIKKLPFNDTPEVGYISEPWRPTISSNLDTHSIEGLFFNPKEHPEFWEPICEENVDKNKYIILGHKCPEGIIIAVERYHDKEKFRIGDEVYGRYNDNFYGMNFTITGFRVTSDRLIVEGEIKGRSCSGVRKVGYSLAYVEKVKKPILTTEDGVTMYEGQIVDMVYKHTATYKSKLLLTKHFKEEKDYLYFSTGEAAHKYIIPRKEILNIYEVEQILFNESIKYKKLTKIVAKLEELVEYKVRE